MSACSTHRRIPGCASSVVEYVWHVYMNEGWLKGSDIVVIVGNMSEGDTHRCIPGCVSCVLECVSHVYLNEG